MGPHPASFGQLIPRPESSNAITAAEWEGKARPPSPAGLYLYIRVTVIPTGTVVGPLLGFCAVQE